MKKNEQQGLRALTELFEKQMKGASSQEQKAMLRAFVAANWPNLPQWSTLEAPLVEEVQKVTIGSGVVIMFQENGRYKVVLGQAGAHYAPKEEGARAAFLANPSYTIPGGFINLTSTDGSHYVAPSEEPEDARIGAARETEEEFKKPDGKPLFQVDPARMDLRDTKTLVFPNGERRVVMGLSLELIPQEIQDLKDHMALLYSDLSYKGKVARQTINPDSGLPELADLAVFDLEDAANGKVNLLHQDQQSLFNVIWNEVSKSKVMLAERREEPKTQSYKDKLENVDGLEARVTQWRQEDPSAVIGITSGAFDILHPGHISFLEDAKRHCDKLVVITASDRTIKALKGDEKPYVDEQKRAQTIAALSMVDAVIISDEFYHETILGSISPNILFKGDDYAGQQIKGAEYVNQVVLIPCAEKDFFSSSAFAKKIQAAAKPQPKPDGLTKHGIPKFR